MPRLDLRPTDEPAKKPRKVDSVSREKSKPRPDPTPANEPAKKRKVDSVSREKSRPRVEDDVEWSDGDSRSKSPCPPDQVTDRQVGRVATDITLSIDERHLEAWQFKKGSARRSSSEDERAKKDDRRSFVSSESSDENGPQKKKSPGHEFSGNRDGRVGLFARKQMDSSNSNRPDNKPKMSSKGTQTQVSSDI
jgi:hypothetical protein